MVQPAFDQAVAASHNRTPGAYVAAADTNSPLQIFFTTNASGRYVYRGRTPPVEWLDLLKAKGWKFKDCKVDGSTQQALYFRYLSAVEEEVDYLIGQNEEVREGGLEPWEYLCQLFGVGVAPLSKSKAKKVGNIYNSTCNIIL